MTRAGGCACRLEYKDPCKALQKTANTQKNTLSKNIAAVLR
ncbi:hypothetical protein NMA510612_0898 [Neisseria meningitidis]|uniref:Uncharacterized protein n=1 Tax=Neisseria meningitidis TaxID=487 RepID=X5EHP4_NEIME|nr:hypothetical protein NMA510612_0898 [Neisseria meningitidis]EFH22104.1 hypothetical protein NEIPOLOT_02105 [Neisseria polysaccharea ATCC 43768]